MNVKKLSPKYKGKDSSILDELVELPTDDAEITNMLSKFQSLEKERLSLALFTQWRQFILHALTKPDKRGDISLHRSYWQKQSYTITAYGQHMFIVLVSTDDGPSSISFDNISYSKTPHSNDDSELSNDVMAGFIDDTISLFDELSKIYDPDTGEVRDTTIEEEEDA